MLRGRPRTRPSLAKQTEMPLLDRKNEPAPPVGQSPIGATVPPVESPAASADFEVVRFCPVCGSQHLRHRFEVSHILADNVHAWAADYGYRTAPVVACSDCGFLCKATRPTASLLEQHYASAGEDYLDRISEDNLPFRVDFRAALHTIQQAFPAGGSVLDLGCASGGFLAALGARWKRYGLDLSELMVRRAAARGGIVVRRADVFSAQFDAASFDVVTAFDVLEHLPQPLEFLSEVRRILKPEGMLLVGTGDAGALCARLAGSRWTYFAIPEHISFFSTRSLERAFRLAGFRRSKFRRIHHGDLTLHVARGWLRAAAKHWTITLCGDQITRLPLFRQKTSQFEVPYFFDHLIAVACGRTRWKNHLHTKRSEE
jgi:SAM-dependent methyltransferase